MKANNNLNKITKNGSSEMTDNNSMEVDTSETSSTTTSVVMRRNKNESGGGSKSNASSTPNRRPISLARLPSPKLDTPSILNRPTSSSVGGSGGGGRRNTISSPRSAEKEANGNSLTSSSTSPRYNVSTAAGLESALNANVVIPPLKLDSEGNTRSRRSTISSSPRGGGGGPYVSYGNNSTSPKSLQTSPRPAASINNISLEGGGGCESAANSPRKSKIPVLRSASTSKAPKQFSFGVGIAKAFNRGKAKAWYQQQQSKGSHNQQHGRTSQVVDIGTSDFTSLMDSLPNS